MYSILIFLLLSLAETIFIYTKWESVKEYGKIINDVSGVIGISNHRHYNKTVRIIAQVLKNFRAVLMIPIGIIILVNFLISITLSIIIEIILLIF